MTTNIWLGNTSANFKVVTVTPSDNIDSLSPAPTINIGLGNRLLTFQGWDASAVADAWNNSTDPILADVFATVSGRSVVFTATVEGQDFELTVSQNVNAVHSSSTYQRLKFNPLPSGGTFTLTVLGQTTGNITYSAVGATLATNIQNAIAALPGFAAGDVTVTAQTTPGEFVLDFSTGRFVGTNVAPVTATHTSLTGGTANTSITSISDGNTGVSQVITLTFPINGTHSEVVNEIQTLATAALGGTFTISISGYGTTAPMPYTVGRSALKAALEAILGADTVNITGGPLYYPADTTYRTLTIEFVGALAGVNVPLMTVAASGNGVNEVQQIRMTGAPTSGTFTLTFGGNTTAALNWNATAAQIQTALTALASIGAGNLVAAGGPLMPTGAPTTVTAYSADNAVVYNSGASVQHPPSGTPYLATVPASSGVLGETFVSFPVYGLVSGAALKLTNLYNSIVSGTSVTVSVVDAGNARIPETAAEYAALTFSGSVTAATITGSIPAVLNSFNVTSLVQTVTNRADWVDGNNVVLRISPQASDPGQNWVPRGYSNAAYVPMLDVTAITGTYAPVEVTFQGSLAATNVAQITKTDVSGTGVIAISTLQNGGTGSYTVTAVQNGGTATVQNISGGTFSLQVNGKICGPIAYNASASDVATAINTKFGSTVCSATGGPAPGSTITITFSGALALTPVTVVYLNALQTNQVGSVKKSTVITGVAPVTPTNVWDLVVCPGEGTLGIATDGIYARVELNITNNLAALTGVSSSRPIGTVYLPLFNLNPRRMEAAINEALGCDACRVTRVGRSKEWANISIPADSQGQYGSAFPSANTSFWYMKDTYRIVFVNQFAASGATSLSATFPLISGVPAKPSVFMQNFSGILNPVGIGNDALDLFPEINRVVIGFQLVEATANPLHIVAVSRSTAVPQNNVSWRCKLMSQFKGSEPSNHTGVSDFINEGKLVFSWVKETINNDGVTVSTVELARTAALDWNSPPEAIQFELRKIFGPNISVSGSLYGSWLSEATKDAPTGGYQDLTIKLTGKLYGVPIDEMDYTLLCGVATTQYETYSSFQKNFSVSMEQTTKTLPPRTNQRERITISNPASLSSIQFGVNDYLFSVSATSTAADIQAAFDQALGANYQSILPDKLSHPVVVYGTTLADGPLEFEFSSWGVQQSPNVTLWVGTVPTGVSYGLITITTQGVALSDENQLLKINGSPYAGTFTVSWGGNTTSALQYNISLANFITALAAATPSAISLTGVTGDANNGFILNWAAAGGNRALATTTSTLHNGKVENDSATIINYGGMNSVLSVVETTKGLGPSYYDVPSNWSLQHVPTSDETVAIDDSASPILYGIDQSCQFSVEAITAAPALFTSIRRRKVFQDGQKVKLIVSGTAPAGLVDGNQYVIKNSSPDGSFQLQTTAGANVIITTAGSGTFTLVVSGLDVSVYSRFAGAQVGLPHNRQTTAATTPEYLPCYWKANFNTITIGVNDGNGLTLGRFDTMAGATAIRVQNTGESTEDNIPAVLFLTNNAASSLLVDAGSVGLSVYAEESSTIGLVTMKNGSLVAGNCSMTKLDKAATATVKTYGNTVIANQTGLS